MIRYCEKIDKIYAVGATLLKKSPEVILYPVTTPQGNDYLLAHNQRLVITLRDLICRSCQNPQGNVPRLQIPPDVLQIPKTVATIFFDIFYRVFSLTCSVLRIRIRIRIRIRSDPDLFARSGSGSGSGKFTTKSGSKSSSGS